jgi:hypothetical protein
MDSQRDLVLASLMRDNQKDVTPLRPPALTPIKPEPKS